MKIIITFIFCFSLLHGFSQDCKTEAANKASTLVRFPDVIMKPTNGSSITINRKKIDPILGKAESWEKGILKNFTGAKLGYSNDYFFDYPTDLFYKATGIKGFYSSKMRFYAYYCYDNNSKIYTEDESGSWLDVTFNNVFASPLCMDVGAHIVNGKYAFKIFEMSHSEGRIDYYEQLAMSNVNDILYKSKNEFIIIRNSGQPVFLPISRKEYLEQMLKDIDKDKESQIAFAKSTYDPKNEAANKAEFDAALKRIDNSKTSTPEQMAPYRKRFVETWETEKQKYDKQITRIETETTGAKETVLEYLKKPSEWLNSTIKQFYSYSYTAKGVTEYFEKLDVFELSREEETRTEIVSINPAYYNKSLGADLPQLIMVYLPKGSYPHMKKVAKLIHQPGALAPLEAILSPAKQTVEPITSIQSTSTYTLSHLPKLTNLSPLIIPADMKPSVVLIPSSNNPTSSVKFNFEIPPLSPKLKLLPAQPLTTEAYNNYVQDLYVKISSAINPDEKKKADEYLKNKKITQSKDISNTGLAAWLQNTPKAGLYLFSKAVSVNPSDALAANNFSAFLIMGGLPEKSIPILDYWNKQKPGAPTILTNLGNAYYLLGDTTRAMKYLQQVVQIDSLNPTANKILCIMYLKKGDVKNAKKCGGRSIATCIDEQVIEILRQLDNKVKAGELMSQFPPLPAKEFPMLKRIRIPAMPSTLDDMEEFAIELAAEKASLKMTIADIEAKTPNISEQLQQKIVMASFKNGISSMRLKAQYIIMDGMLTYQNNRIKESDVFFYRVKKMNIIYNAKVKAIQKIYDEKLKKLEGGEAGDEDKIAALELAKCQEVNAETGGHLVGLSGLINQYASRQEYISRKFFRDYANWAPYWMPETTISFSSIERDYLKDILNILGEYQVIKKMDCSVFEPLQKKDGVLQEWEDEYCANFKGKVGIGPAKVAWACNSISIEGGEGIVGAVEVKFADGGAVEELTLEAGFGTSWNLGSSSIGHIEAGASAKEFIKLGSDKSTGKWVVKDGGVKAEASIEGKIGNISSEVKVLELSVAVNAGFTTGGVLAPLINIDSSN